MHPIECRIPSHGFTYIDCVSFKTNNINNNWLFSFAHLLYFAFSGLELQVREKKSDISKKYLIS